MTRTARLMLCVLVLVMMVVVTSTVVAQDAALQAQKKAQARVMADRAARADAMRKLGERIKGLALTSNTKVKDFVTESDEIKTAMDAYLLGMRSGPSRHSDGVSSVDMEITLDELVRALRRIYASHAKTGSKFKEGDIINMTTTNKEKVIKVVGDGAVPAEFAVDDQLPFDSDGNAPSFGKFSQNVRTYWTTTVGPAGRLMAQRAARLDAMRRLVERIKGVQINSTTTVKDFVAQGDDINVIADGFLKGAKEVGIRYHSSDLICEVEMQVKLSQVFEALHSWTKVEYKGDEMKLRKIEERTTKTESTILTETGVGIPPARYLRKAPPAAQQVAQLAAKMPDWANGTLTAVGNGAVDANDTNPARAKLMAIRAADLDARRKLAERIEGLPITSNTTVRNFMTESDEIQTSVFTFQTGAYVVEGSQKVENGVATVTVAIEMKPLWNSVIYFKKKLGVSVK